VTAGNAVHKSKSRITKMNTKFSLKKAAIMAAFAGSLLIPRFAQAACAVQAASALPYSVPAGGVSGAVQISAPAGCPWTFHNRGVSWIQILSAQSGTGPALIYYSVAPNPGRARSAGFGPIGVTVNTGCGLGGRSSACGPSSASTGFTISLYQAGR
jgi:hypothetical protein